MAQAPRYEKVTSGLAKHLHERQGLRHSSWNDQPAISILSPFEVCNSSRSLLELSKYGQYRYKSHDFVVFLRDQDRVEGNGSKETRHNGGHHNLHRDIMDGVRIDHSG